MVVGSGDPARCGVAGYTAQLCRRLAESGMKIRVITCGDLDPSAWDRRVMLSTLGRCWSFLAAVEVIRLLKEARLDVIHIQYGCVQYGRGPMIYLLPMLLRAGGIRTQVITTVHDLIGWSPVHRCSHRRGLRHVGLSLARLGLCHEFLGLFRWSDKICLTNEHQLKAFQKWFHAYVERTVVIPIGANVADGHPTERAQVRREVRATLGLNDEQPLLAFYGFIHAGKGIENLLEAVAELAPAYPSLRVMVVGGNERAGVDGSETRQYLARLHTLADSLGIADRVHWTGYRPAEEVSRFLYAADMATLPFGTGVTLGHGTFITALAHGMPVVTTYGQQIPDPLANGENVVLVPPHDAAALAKAIRRVIEKPALRHRLAAGAMSLAHEFSWDRIAAETIALYQAHGQP